MTTRLPYPWSQHDGLCTALRNAALWGSVVGDIGWRRHFKRVMKRRGERDATPITITDNQQFGENFLALLQRRTAREELGREFEKNKKYKKSQTTFAAFLGQSLHSILLREHPHHYPGWTACCDEQKDVYLLNISKFQTWLKERSLEDLEQARLLTLFACAFAMVQPGIGPHIRGVLINRDGCFHSWVDDPHRLVTVDEPALADRTSQPELAEAGRVVELDATLTTTQVDVLKQDDLKEPSLAAVPVSERPTSPPDILHSRSAAISFESHADQEASGGAMPPALQSSAAIPHPADDDSRELLRLFRDHHDWLAQLPIPALRHAASLLLRRATHLELQLRALDEHKARVQSQLDEARRLPWLAPPFDADVFLAPDQGTMLSLTTDLTAVEGEVARVLQAHVQLQALTERLGHPVGPVVSGAAASLSSIADQMEGRVQTFADELRRINAQETRAAEFLERFITGDKRAAEALTRDIDPEQLEHLALFVVRSQPRTDVGRRYAGLAGNIGLLGALLTYVAHRRPSDGITAISRILSEPSPALTQASFAEALCYLSLAQLQELATEAPHLAPEVAQQMLVAAAATNAIELLDYLEPLLSSPSLHPTCAAVYRAAINDRRRGNLVDVVGQLQSSMGPHDSATRQQSLARAKKRLMELIEKPPGMRGNFHRLRVVARVQYFLPLREIIERDDAAEAQKQWKRYGSLDEMVEQCVRSAKHLEFVERTHYQQTRNYVAMFETELSTWRRLQSRPTGVVLEVAAALNSIQAESEGARGGQPAALCAALQRVFAEHQSSLSRYQAFGRRCEVDSVHELSVRVLSSDTNPLRTWTFPQAIAEGSVPIWRYLADWLREAVGIGPKTLSDAVEEYLADNELLAAQRAASQNAALEIRVAGEIERKQATIRTENAELFEAAHAARMDDEYINLCLLEVEDALKGLDMRAAITRIHELRGFVRRYQLGQDPRRRLLVELLMEAGEPPAADASTKELEERIEALRKQHEYRRLHLHVLRDGIEDTALPTSLREAWAAASRRLDRPVLWPDSNLSIALADSVDTVARFLIGKRRHRDADPATVDVLVESLEEWVPARMRETLEKKGEKNARSPLLELSNEIKNYCPDRKILQLLGETAPAAKAETADETWQSDGAVPLRHRSGRGPSSRAEVAKLGGAPTTGRTIAELRAFLNERAEKEPAPAVASQPASLRDSMRRRDWQDGRRIAAELVLKRRSKEGTRLSSVEAAYAICLAYNWPGDDRSGRARALRYACIAALDNREVSFFVPSTMLDELLARALVSVGASEQLCEEGGNVSDALARVLASLPESASSSLTYEWLSELLDVAVAFVSEEGVLGNARLATQLWAYLKGINEVAKPRCDLLHTLYRMRQTEALRVLARGAKPLDDLIIACITAFERAESDPEVRARTPQIAAALREQARGKLNTKPWTLLLARIEPTSGEGVALRCIAEADRAEEDANGNITIPIRLIPPAADPPEIVELEVGGGHPSTSAVKPTRALLEDEILLKEKVVAIQVVSHGTVATGDELEVPYRVTGRTIRGNKIDVRGSWRVRPAKSGVFAPIREEEIKSAWPGASGAPVAGSGNFFGRDSELRAIQSHICASHRQESVMLFGQRRIGKTSLLLQLVSEFPPRPGAVSAAYLDVSGLAAQPGTMSKAFFNMIVAALDSDPRNEPVRKELQRHSKDFEVRSLARGVDPSTSLYYALEGLVHKLAHHSRGAISRLALFVDEFDRFVEPLLSGQRSEIEKFMWELRKVIQQSPSISLILAGSGIQRLFVDDYEAPLFGSINEVEIGPFKWEADRDAIERIFMPGPVRRQMCRDDVWPDVARHAYELSGGHPYYLAMLGFSAAIVLNGRGMTPVHLNRVVEEMIGGRVKSMGWKINASRFYAPIFETLKRVSPRTRAVAKLVLTQIAQRTTLEYPWLLVSDSIDSSDLRAVGDARRLDALKALDSEGAIEMDRGGGAPRVRIRVPLTAAAVREDAVLIRQEGTRDLHAHEDRS